MRCVMGFINDVRNKVDTNSDNVNPLDNYSMYNFNDILNDIYIIDDLREKGNEKGAKTAYDSFVRHGVEFRSGDKNVGNFLSYLMEQSKLEDIPLLGDTSNSPSSNSPSTAEKAIPVNLTDNEKLVSAVIIEESRASDDFRDALSYDTLCKFLNLSHSREANLTNEEYSQFAGYEGIQNSDMYKSVTRELVRKYPIPEVTHIVDIYDTNDLSDLYDEYSKDKYFCSNYKIKNVYAIENNKQSKNAFKQGKNSMILNSGTSNESLIKILSGGFKLPSQLAHENGVQMSGQMYGDAIYFARPNQISKNTAYMDRHNRGSKFIMVAEVFYDHEKNADNRGHNFKYDGHTLVHAHGVGQFYRDEYMVHPSQIKLKYVLEVDKGRFVKPKPKDNVNMSNKTNITLSLDDLDDGQQI